jgi:kynurenine 3-monooxygenase
MSGDATKKVLIVGAGPVGSLTALTFDKRGWKVEVWEGREGEFDSSLSYLSPLTSSLPDPRGTDVSPANLRSINLAISSRGLEALKSVDPSLGMFSFRVHVSYAPADGR